MLKSLILPFALLCECISFGQKTFTTEKQAISWLEKTFSTCLIVKVTDRSETYTTSYKLDSISLTFSTTEKVYYSGEEPKKGETYRISFNDKLTITKRIDTPVSFLRIEGAEIRTSSGGRLRYTSDVGQLDIPFNFSLENDLEKSIQNAFDCIRMTWIKEYEEYSKAYDEKKRKEEEKLKEKFAREGLRAFNVFTSDSLMVNLFDFVKSNRSFREKPTLLVTWSNLWCQPCMKIIDEFLNSGLATQYNIVLVNKDSGANLSKCKNKMAEHTPDYTKNVLSLFDLNSQLEPLDHNSAPFFIWLDKDLTIVSTKAGYGIKLTEILEKLAAIGN